MSHTSHIPCGQGVQAKPGREVGAPSASLCLFLTRGPGWTGLVVGGEGTAPWRVKPVCSHAVSSPFWLPIRPWWFYSLLFVPMP